MKHSTSQHVCDIGSRLVYGAAISAAMALVTTLSGPSAFARGPAAAPANPPANVPVNASSNVSANENTGQGGSQSANSGNESDNGGSDSQASARGTAGPPRMTAPHTTEAPRSSQGDANQSGSQGGNSQTGSRSAPSDPRMHGEPAYSPVGYPPANGPRGGSGQINLPRQGPGAPPPGQTYRLDNRGRLIHVKVYPGGERERRPIVIYPWYGWPYYYNQYWDQYAEPYNYDNNENNQNESSVPSSPPSEGYPSQPEAPPFGPPPQVIAQQQLEASPQYTALVTAQRQAQLDYETSRRAVLDRVHATPEYQQAAAQKREYQEAIDAMQSAFQQKTGHAAPTTMVSGDATQVLDISSRMTRMESAAIAKDPTVLDAQKRLVAATDQLNAMRKQVGLDALSAPPQ